MQTRRHNAGLIAGILRGDRPGRLVALVDGAAERESARQAAYESWTPPEMPNPWARRPQPPKPEYRKPYMWTADNRRQWATLAPSQRALAASKHATEKVGGAPWRYRDNTIDELAADYDCSRRLVLMAKKLRAAGPRPLLRAVAAGTIGLADAVAHIDVPADELRQAIQLVKRRKARSLREACALRLVSAL